MTDATQHFGTEAAGTPTAPGRYVDVNAISPLELVPGLHFRPVLGERTMLNFVSFAPHTEAPMHVHEEEQIVLVIDGEFEFEIEGDADPPDPSIRVVMEHAKPSVLRVRRRLCAVSFD